MSPWLVFWITYFAIYLFIAWKQETINVFAFFIGYVFLRVPIAATFAFLYWLAQDDNVVALKSELPEQAPVPQLQLSDIMEDDLRERGVEIEMDQPVYIIGQEN